MKQTNWSQESIASLSAWCAKQSPVPSRGISPSMYMRKLVQKSQMGVQSSPHFIMCLSLPKIGGGRQDLNLDRRFWRPPCCRYTTPPLEGPGRLSPPFPSGDGRRIAGTTSRDPCVGVSAPSGWCRHHNLGRPNAGAAGPVAQPGHHTIPAAQMPPLRPRGNTRTSAPLPQGETYFFGLFTWGCNGVVRRVPSPVPPSSSGLWR